MNQMSSPNGSTAVGVKNKAADRLQGLRVISQDKSRIDEFLERAIVLAKHDGSEALGDLIVSTLSDLRTSEEDDQFRNHCNFEVHSDKFACFILEDREKIVASNQLARERFDIKAATDVADLDLVGLEGHPFAEVVAKAMDHRTYENMGTPIAQAYSPSLKRRLDVAILHIHVCALMGIKKEIILISDAITPSTLDLFADKFALSNAEASIVQRFSAGQSIDEIAEKRGRSVATVKTQFYKVLEKCGAGSQSELLQMVARIESLNAATSSINEEFSYPHRRKFTMIRPGNRTLDVVSAGKPDGRPVISCNSFMFRSLPAWLEEELYQNNIKLFSIAPPGSGNTLPQPEGQTMEACFAEDVAFLLDSIGAETAVLSGAGTSFPICLEVAHLLPNRIKAVHCSSAFAPAERLKAEHLGVIPALRKLAFGRDTQDLGVVTGGVFRLINRFGIAHAAKLILGSDRSSLDVILRPDHLVSLKSAFDASMSQAVDFNVETLWSALTQDWEPRLATCPVPVHFAIGDQDAVGPVGAIEQIAADHAGKITFTKIEDANSLYRFTHHQAYFDAISNAIENP